MTIDYSRESLLREVTKHSGMHLDSSLVEVAISHNEALRKSLASSDSQAIQSMAFGHMTSNQFIALAHLKRQDEVGKSQAQEVLKWSLDFASGLLKAFHLLNQEQREILNDETLLGGLKKGNTEGIQQFVVDIASIRIGMLMIPHLLPNGYIMCQSLPSLSNSTSSTVSHSKRLQLLSSIISSELKSPYDLGKRLCVKVPSSFEGLKACAGMKKLGIKALATTVFSVEQGLAAMEAAEVQLVSPYIRTLSSHFYEANKTPQDSRLYDDSNPGVELVRTLQIQFNRRRLSKLDNGTKMLAASLIEPLEVVKLTGIDSFTLFDSVLETLNSTSSSAESEAIISEALKKWNVNQDLTGDGQPRGELTPEEIEVNSAKDGKGGWLDLESSAGKKLIKALASERVDWLMKDALKIFGAAEVELRELVGKKMEEMNLDLGIEG